MGKGTDEGGPLGMLAAELVKITPSERQLAYQSHKFYAFIHFSVNTFTDKEWGDAAKFIAADRNCEYLICLKAVNKRSSNFGRIDYTRQVAPQNNCAICPYCEHSRVQAKRLFEARPLFICSKEAHSKEVHMQNHGK